MQLGDWVESQGRGKLSLMASDLGGKLDEIFSKLSPADASADGEDVEELLKGMLDAPATAEDEEDGKEKVGVAESAPAPTPADDATPPKPTNDATVDTPQLRLSQAEVHKLKEQLMASNKQKMVIAREEAADIERRERLVFARDGNIVGLGGFAPHVLPPRLENRAANFYSTCVVSPSADLYAKGPY
jgi:hypothetical protein